MFHAGYLSADERKRLQAAASDIVEAGKRKSKPGAR